MGTTYTKGEPCWLDCGTELDKAPAFYTALLGWEVQSLGEEAGNYQMASLKGETVAGFGPKQNPGPPYWNVYFATDDADKTTAIATEQGATVLMGVTDVMDAGRMAVLQDPIGAVFSIWQAGTHPGFGRTGEPGTFSWAELVTTDPEASKAFYTTVFGFDTRTSTDAGFEYTEYQLGGRSVAGMMRKPDMMPAEVPPFWGAYFAVTDTDATLAKVAELGGATLAGPMDMEVGRFAACVDNVGAVFNVITFAPRTTN